MNDNTYLDYIKYNSDVLQTNFINKHSCCLKEADLETAWWAHISLESCQRKLNKCHFLPLRNFLESIDQQTITKHK